MLPIWSYLRLRNAAAVVLIGTVMVAVALACESNSPTADLSDIAVDTDSATQQVNLTPTAFGHPIDVGATLRVLLGCTDSLDPAVGDCHDIYNEVYARLTRITGSASDPIAPDLAESWAVSSDGKTYTFMLRRDLKFSDGTPLTSQDFKWSWERALNSDTESSTAESVLGSIVGAAAVASGDADSLEGVTAADDRTLIVELNAPNPLFLYQVSDHVAAPLSRQNVANWQVEFNDLTAANVGELPAVTGPFRVAELGIDGRAGLRLEPNPNYYGTQPLLDEVALVPLEVRSGNTGQFDAAGAMLAMYESGEIDISPFASRDTQTADGINMQRTLSDAIGFLVFNASIPPLDDVNVRRALIAASNVTVHMDPTAAYSLMWERLPGYDPELAVDRYDLSVAAREVAASGYTNLAGYNPLTICYWNNRSSGRTIRLGT